MSPTLQLFKFPLDSFVWQKVHSLMQPLAISIIPTVGFSRTFGRPTFVKSESASSILFVPLRVDVITSKVFPNEFGPSRLACGLNFSTVDCSAFGKQPATIRGLDVRVFILCTILSAVASLTEQVTIMFKSDSSSL